MCLLPFHTLRPFCIGWALTPNLVSFQTRSKVTSSGKRAPGLCQTASLPWWKASRRSPGRGVRRAWLRSEAPGRAHVCPWTGL